MCFTERVWAAARDLHSWAYAQSLALSWQPARKRTVVGEVAWAGCVGEKQHFTGQWTCSGHSVLPAVKVRPAERVEKHGTNSCTLQ